MKAKRKSDGKIIEVETYMLNSRRGKDGLWESSYKDNKSGLVYEASDLDFDVEEAEQKEITIDRDEYEKLCKYRRYCSNWTYSIVVCPHCGEFNPDGYICANCGKDLFN